MAVMGVVACSSVLVSMVAARPRTARVEGVDLVVMGSYGGAIGGVDKIFFGSTAEKVVRTAGCPVLTVPLPTKRAKVKTGKSL